MPTTRHGDVEIYYETFGDPAQPTLLLINGLGSQCINYDVEWCELFSAEGFFVVRFDNRDVGLSSQLDGVDYTLADMADDAVSVLDALGVARAHVLGCSMGGMIAQRLAIDHPERLLSMTSVMSRPGEPGYGESSEAALEFLLAPPAPYRVGLHRATGGRPPRLRLQTRVARRRGTSAAHAAAAYDRCFAPAGVARQMRAVAHERLPGRTLRALAVPTLVIHGSRDTLIDPSGGRRTAELIPGARYVEIEGMGHDYPPAVWAQWVSDWSASPAAARTRGGHRGAHGDDVLEPLGRESRSRGRWRTARKDNPSAAAMAATVPPRSTTATSRTTSAPASCTAWAASSSEVPRVTVSSVTTDLVARVEGAGDATRRHRGPWPPCAR